MKAASDCSVRVSIVESFVEKIDAWRRNMGNADERWQN